MDMMELKHIFHNIIETGMDMVRTASVKDVTIFKFALITFGMLIAIANYRTAKKAAPLLFLICIGCFGYLIWNYANYLKAIHDNL